MIDPPTLKLRQVVCCVKIDPYLVVIHKEQVGMPAVEMNHKLRYRILLVCISSCAYFFMNFVVQFLRISCAFG